MDDEARRMQILGQRIKWAREQLSLSQEDLAHRWGKKQYQISEYENGKRRIYAHDLPRLANALHVQINYFFQNDQDETQSKQSGNDDENDLVEEQIKTLNHIFRNLHSQSAREFALKVLVELRHMTERE